MNDYLMLEDALRSDHADDRTGPPATPNETVLAWVLSVLDDVTAERTRLRAIRHPLGFVCLPVIRDGAHGVCVHAWHGAPSPAELTTSQVHCHSWHLCSHVLYGTLGNELFEVDEVDRATEPEYRLFDVRGDGDVDEIRATTTLVTSRPLRTEWHHAGATYAMGAGEFHRSAFDRGAGSATVVLARHQPGGADLSLGPIDKGTHSTRRNRCTEAETARIARSVADRLRDGASYRQKSALLRTR